MRLKKLRNRFAAYTIKIRHRRAPKFNFHSLLKIDSSIFLGYPIADVYSFQMGVIISLTTIRGSFSTSKNQIHFKGIDKKS